jgi:carbonic anhydrase/acetyltransferase-like protein (isoleucine patch superfamily)
MVISLDARVFPFRGAAPLLGELVFLAPFAVVVGDVLLGERSSLWFHSVVRGDVNFVRIGRGVNLQDHGVVHGTTDTHPVRIGDAVTIGHAAVVHGATLGDGCLVGIGARILDGAVVGEETIVAAGSVVPPGTVVPPRVLAVGSPVRVQRPLTAEECGMGRRIAAHYEELARRYARELGLPPAEA